MGCMKMLRLWVFAVLSAGMATQAFAKDHFACSTETETAMIEFQQQHINENVITYAVAVLQIEHFGPLHYPDDTMAGHIVIASRKIIEAMNQYIGPEVISAARNLASVWDQQYGCSP